MAWLLENNVHNAMRSAKAQGFTPSAAQLSELQARAENVLTVAGDSAQVNVVGVLTMTPDYMAMYFGGGNTTYPDIIGALAEADANPDVKTIRMFVHSPGGTVSGLFETLAALENVEKPIEVFSSLACSAAYAIAAVAGPITATTPAATFGSIGIVAEGFVDDDHVSVTSTKAPKKRHDLKTEEGIANLREELDAVHDLFVEAIAAGRGTDPDDVNANFGEGGMLLAQKAQTRGMIDTLSFTKPTAAEPSVGAKREASSMDINKLRAEHPDVFAAAVAIGTNEERDRAGAHLKMGEASGDMQTAIQAVSDGSGMTATLTATYMAAGMTRRDIQDRADDLAPTAPTAPAAQEETDEKAKQAAASADIFAIASEQCGIEMGAKA